MSPPQRGRTLAAIRDRFGREAAGELEVGIGDDAAVVRFRSLRQVVSTDLLVEGVDLPAGTSPDFLARKAMAATSPTSSRRGPAPRSPSSRSAYSRWRRRRRRRPVSSTPSRGPPGAGPPPRRRRPLRCPRLDRGGHRLRRAGRRSRGSAAARAPGQTSLRGWAGRPGWRPRVPAPAGGGRGATRRRGPVPGGLGSRRRARVGRRRGALRAARSRPSRRHRSGGGGRSTAAIDAPDGLRLRANAPDGSPRPPASVSESICPRPPLPAAGTSRAATRPRPALATPSADRRTSPIVGPP